MPGARFFPDARLNFAENLLRFRDDAAGARVPQRARHAARASRTGSCTRASRASRMASQPRASSPAIASPAFCPTFRKPSSRCWRPPASGAVWSSCSPDFGVHGVVDRFGQIAPKVLFTADGYFYAGKTLDSLGADRRGAGEAAEQSSGSSSFPT